jgi:CheY-like chemotaxis protein
MDSSPNVRILLVDDNARDLESVAEALRWCGLGDAVRIARGGQEALDYLFGRGQFHNRRRFPLPQLLLIDLNMPAVDGYQVLETIKQCDELCRIPAVALCMSAQEGYRAMAFRARPNDFLVKPISRESLWDLPRRLRNWSLRLDLPDDLDNDGGQCGSRKPGADPDSPNEGSVFRFMENRGLSPI